MGKILIVDDDQGTTKLLEFILAKEGYDVATINNGSETLSTAFAYHPNLILLDLMMPSVDGFEICKNLRAESQFAHIPIVFFTSVSDVAKKVTAFGLGANDYMIKPIHPRELKLRIKALIGNGGNGNHR
ncbi:MAG: response regulator [Anaerolineae bacterium]|nr:response regulator [Anaerolineae bacterium]MCI0607660.1 response regulator [Anaerolineae bacterium]